MQISRVHVPVYVRVKIGRIMIDFAGKVTRFRQRAAALLLGFLLTEIRHIVKALSEILVPTTDLQCESKSTPPKTFCDIFTPSESV